LRVRLLLDTHVFLWLLAEPERLGRHLGRIEDPDHPSRYVSDRMRAVGVEPLAIEHAHALAVADLPALHRDPFDRMLVAQARHLRLRIVTRRCGHRPLRRAHDPRVTTAEGTRRAPGMAVGLRVSKGG
jgi:PIN domain nuclease of toxin-antitoxin system